MSSAQNYLITIQGTTTERDVLERFTEQLEHLKFSVRDLHYLNFDSSLSLLMCLELAESADKESLIKVLDKLARQFQLELLIYPLPGISIVTQIHRNFLTLLSRKLTLRLLTKLFRHFRRSNYA